MTQSTSNRSNRPSIVLPRAAVRLLRAIALHDKDADVAFESARAGRWRLTGTNYCVNDRTFHPLDSYYLVDIGNGRTNPVRITTSHTAAGPGVAA